jgi:shikimate dehydrogenase
MTVLVGVMGWPIAHSISPEMQNAALRALGLDWLYLRLAVRPDDVPEAAHGLRALGFAGVNVTIPHKVAMLPLMDQLTPEAVAVGAVNTVIIRDGHMTGHNTDTAGFLTDLAQAGFAPAGQTALVLGAGGAARSIVYALARAGARVTVWNRTPARAAALIAGLAPFLPGAGLAALPQDSDLAGALAEANLLVNCTSVGMTGGPPGSPLLPGLVLRRGMVVYDLIYTPPLTPLLRQARASGARTVSGLGMLVHQGAEALSLWTGQPAPVDVMTRAARRALARRALRRE